MSTLCWHAAVPVPFVASGFAKAHLQDVILQSNTREVDMRCTHLKFNHQKINLIWSKTVRFSELLILGMQ